MRGLPGMVWLSEQQMVDCVYAFSGCNGGFPSEALNYIKNAGGQMPAD